MMWAFTSETQAFCEKVGRNYNKIMKDKFNLDEMGLESMNAFEMEQIDGGSLSGIFGAVVSAISDFAHGVVQGYNDASMQRIINNSQQFA